MVEFEADVMRRRAHREEMIPLLERHEIQVLLGVGMSQAEVARRTAVAAKTVRRIAGEGTVKSVDDTGEHARRRIGRPSKAEPYRDLVRVVDVQSVTLIGESPVTDGARLRLLMNERTGTAVASAAP